MLMGDKSLIEKLGFEADDKVVILHIDDMGYSHSSNAAAFELMDYGIASCGSVLVPAPWFFEAASICKKNPKYDVGVHLTLTCEYDTYRWRALSSVDTSTGLLDPQGCLWKTSEEAIAHITSEAAESEMRFQIQKALDNGIHVTHIDTHMGTVMDPKFLPLYLKLAKEFNVPAFLPKVTKPMLIAMGMGDSADFILKMFQELEAAGVPMLDQIIIDTGGVFPNKTDYYCKRFTEIKPGLTHLLFHAAKMSPELLAIEPSFAEERDQDYRAFLDPRLKECITELNLKVIGYKKIRDVLHNS